MEDSKRLIIWLRCMIPLVCATLWVSYPHQDAVRYVLVVSAVDVGVSLWRSRRHLESPSELRMAVSRDAVYAMLFYVATFQGVVVPALAIAPIVATEILVLLGWRFFTLCLLLEGVLVALHMGTTHVVSHHFLHPGWAMWLIVATVATIIFGVVLSHLRTLSEETAAQKMSMRESLIEMLEVAFSGECTGEFVYQDEFRLLIEDICRSGDRDKARELGAQLSEILSQRQSHLSLFTSRELEILGHLASGLSYSKIGDKLFVNAGTVRAHAASIMRKANAHTRKEAVDWARENRLIPSSD